MQRVMNDLVERIAHVVGWDLGDEALDFELTDQEVAEDLDYGRTDETARLEPTITLH